MSSAADEVVPLGPRDQQEVGAMHPSFAPHQCYHHWCVCDSSCSYLSMLPSQQHTQHYVTCAPVPHAEWSFSSQNPATPEQSLP